jgi:hypothetical protein
MLKRAIGSLLVVVALGVAVSRADAFEGVADVPAAEVPTGPEHPRALEAAPVGSLLWALQLAVLLACPLACSLAGALERLSARRRPGESGPSRVSTMARLLAVALPLYFAWEMLQAPLFTGMPEGWLRATAICALATLGDGVLVGALALTGASGGSRRPRARATAPWF